MSEIGNADDTNNDSSREREDLGMFPPASSVSPKVQLEATPSEDTAVNDKSLGESGRIVVEPPKSGVASPATPMTNDDELQYSLTLKEVPGILKQASRKVPSARTLSRYCNEGSNHLKCRMVKTSYGQEWLVNKESLDEYIDQQPIEIESNDAALVTDANCVAGDAKAKRPVEKTLTSGGMPTAVTDAKTETTIGEERSLGEVLIENERLLARNEGLKELLAEVKDDKAFLREEVRHARQYKGDMKQLTQDVLDTLTAVASGGRLLRERSDDGDKDVKDDGDV